MKTQPCCQECAKKDSLISALKSGNHDLHTAWKDTMQMVLFLRLVCLELGLSGPALANAELLCSSSDKAVH